MKPLAALAALTLTLAATALPATARDSFVIDNAHLFSSAAVSEVNAKVADFNALTHKEVVVVTEPTVDGTPQAAAEKIVAQQQVNGVLIYIAKSPKTIGIVPDRAAARFFPSGTTAAIRKAMVASFNSGDFNGGLNNGVDLTLAQYRSHFGSLKTTHANVPAPAAGSTATADAGGFSMGWIWWLIVLAVIFFIVRAVFRAMAGPRVGPGGYGPGGYGAPGYGPGPGYGGGFGGGGSFFSGLLGGLGGAWLGNELFGRRDEGGYGGNVAGMGGDPNAADASGWQNDPGQADMGNASFGGYGDSGDSGGGGWGDSGGGDSGGGW